MSVNFLFSLTTSWVILFTACSEPVDLQSHSDKETEVRTNQFFMPHEDAAHEGTWLQWPHHYQYGTTYRNRIESTWINMAKHLSQSEKVHIIAYNSTEKNRINNLLKTVGVNMAKIDYTITKTNDVWVRDNGPIYTKDGSGNHHIENWGFNGWGYKAPYTLCNAVPSVIAQSTGVPHINLNSILRLEGGAFEVDGRGTLMACKSSIINNNRNPGKTLSQIETILSQYLGVGHFIWLDGEAGLEITDMHIDGFAKFADDHTIVTMNTTDLDYYNVPSQDIEKLYNATDINQEPYDFVFLPLTQNNVKTTFGKNLGYKGSYVNYYIANTKVLVPTYNDANDQVAINIIQQLHPDKHVVGIDVRNLYQNGGMVHCVTQQQPL